MPLATLHPLAAPASPFAHVLGQYDRADPRDAGALAAVAKGARGWGAASLRFEAGVVPHSGGHGGTRCTWRGWCTRWVAVGLWVCIMGYGYGNGCTHQVHACNSSQTVDNQWRCGSRAKV